MNNDSPLVFQQIEIGPARNYAYLLGDKRAKALAVIDPGWDIPYLLQEAQALDARIVCVLLTHGHLDHTNGLDDLLAVRDIPVYISEHEAEFYRPDCPNLRPVADGEQIAVGDIRVECLWTPGHSPGCQCFQYGDLLLTGDTLFIEGCGRCDLPGGAPKAMYNSLVNVIAKLPDATVIYPGHAYGPAPHATLGAIKQTNPCLRLGNLTDFLAMFG